MARVRIEGLSDLRRNLRRLERHTAGRALTDMTVAAGEPIRDEWSRLAPRSDIPGGTTGKGHAADHIRVVAKDSPSPHVARARVGPEKDFWYLSFAEFGTPRQPALAPGRRAAKRTMGEAVDTLASRLRRAIRTAVQ